MPAKCAPIVRNLSILGYRIFTETAGLQSSYLIISSVMERAEFRAQELCESGGGRLGLPSLIVRTVSVDVKQNFKTKLESIAILCALS